MYKENGFTLIELLVVVAIVGILAAVAIPQFNSYRKQGYDTGAVSLMKNIVTAEEAYFVDHDSYASCSDDSCVSALPGLDLDGVMVYSHPEADLHAHVTGDIDSFTILADDERGSTRYDYDSEVGKVVSSDGRWD